MLITVMYQYLDKIHHTHQGFIWKVLNEDYLYCCDINICVTIITNTGTRRSSAMDLQLQQNPIDQKHNTTYETVVD